MYTPELEEETKFVYPSNTNTMPRDQEFIPYDDRAIGGSGKYNLDNVPNAYEIDDESEMFEVAEQN